MGMKVRLKAHPEQVGPEIHLDLNDVRRMEMHGSRESEAGWVLAKLYLQAGQLIEVKMIPADYDQLVGDWIGQ